MNDHEEIHDRTGTGGRAATAEAVSRAEALGEEIDVLLDAGVPFILWGPPGIGKTRMIEAVAREKGWHLEVVLGSIREPQDITGFPAVRDDGTFALLAPDYVTRINAAIDAGAPGALLFLDEVSNCAPPQQAALLRVATDRVVGDARLPDCCRIVFAANPADQATDGWDLAAPMANRMSHLHLDVPDPSEWAAGLLRNWGVPTDEPNPVAGRLTEARAAVAGFVNARPQRLHVMPQEAAAAGGAWPSPRTWAEHVVPALARTAAITRPRVRERVERDLVVAAVGEGTGLEFLAWRDEQDLVLPADLLAAPGGCQLPERTDKLYAVVAGVTALAIARGDEDSWACAWAVLGRVAAAGNTEIAAFAARALIGARPTGAPIPPEIAAFLPFLRAAGVLPEDAL